MNQETKEEKSIEMEAVMLSPVSTDLFSPKFPGAQIHELKCEGKTVSDALPVGFVLREYDLRITDSAEKGIHRAFIVRAPTGKGKSHWVRHIVRIAMKKINEKSCRGKKVLYLCNRLALSVQQIKEAVKAADPYGYIPNITRECNEYHTGCLHLMTFHRFYQLLVENGEEFFSDYRIVVADEAHFFVSDALFNANTYEILKSLPRVFGNALRIYMTATPEDVLDPIYSVEWDNTEGEFAQDNCTAQCDDEGNYLTDDHQTLPRMDMYSFSYDYSSYDNIGFFQKAQGVLDLILSSEKDEKWIVFVGNKLKGKSLFADLQEKGISALYLDRDSRNDKDISIRQAWDRLLEEGKLTDLQVLISTPVLDNGFSIKDSEVKNIVINTDDRTEFLQELGRIRVADGQRINLFISKMKKTYFKSRDRILHDFCLFYGSDKIPEFGNGVEIQQQRTTMLKHVINSEDTIGYLTSRTVPTDYGDAELPRINDLARWKAWCISREEKTYDALCEENPQEAATAYKMAWLKGDAAADFHIRDMDVPLAEEAAKKIEDFLRNFLNRPMLECTSKTDSADERIECFKQFSVGFQSLILDLFPEEKKRINTGKNRAIWKHKAIRNWLDRIQNGEGSYECHKYLGSVYAFDKDGECWVLNRRE